SAGWVRAALRPLGTPIDDPDVTIEVSQMSVRPGRRIAHGMALVEDGVWVGDRFGRGGILRIHNGHLSAVVSPDIPPTWLNDLYVLLVDAALARRGGMVLRMSAVQTATRRIGVSGFSGSGKTRLLLTLIGVHGATLIGDSVVGCLADGTIAPMAVNLKIRPEHRDLFPMEGSIVSASRTWLARKFEGSDSAGGRRHRSPGRRVGPLVAERIRARGERQLDGGGLGIGSVGGNGRLDSLVMLRHSSAVAPTDFLLTTTAVSLNAGHLVQSVARGLWPEAAAMRLAHQARNALVAEVVRHASVIEVPPPLLPAPSRELAAELVA
ncbi:MAG: hypothetical protein WD204_05010, partial [Acidimicrobiia bacterium]